VASSGSAIFTNKVNIVERLSLIDPNLMGWQIGDKHIALERFPVPPLEEQYEIVAIIKAEAAKLDTLTAKAQRGIELLQERRTALISVAVTGKIDVREFARGGAEHYTNC